MPEQLLTIYYGPYEGAFCSKCDGRCDRKPKVHTWRIVAGTLKIADHIDQYGFRVITARVADRDGMVGESAREIYRIEVKDVE